MLVFCGHADTFWHERLLLSRISVDVRRWIVATPDLEIFEEDLKHNLGMVHVGPRGGAQRPLRSELYRCDEADPRSTPSDCWKMVMVRACGTRWEGAGLRLAVWHLRTKLFLQAAARLALPVCEFGPAKSSWWLNKANTDAASSETIRAPENTKLCFSRAPEPPRTQNMYALFRSISANAVATRMLQSEGRCNA